jgi:hypothetical protein
VLLFPDGKLPSPRWRPFGWLNGVMAVAGSLAAVFLPGPSPWIAAIDNPFGAEGLKDIYNLVDGSLEALSYELRRRPTTEVQLPKALRRHDFLTPS